MTANAPKSSIQFPQEASRVSPTSDPLASELRGFGLLGVVAILLILFGNFQFHVGNSGYPVLVPSSAALVLLWAWRSRTPWRELGFVRPKSWVATIALGLIFGCAFKLLMKAVVMPLLGADPINQSYHFLAGNRAAIPFALFAFIVRAGVGEEIVFRGYMFERLGKLLGSGVGAKIAIVLITSLLFGLGHYSNQGWTGAEQATIVGVVYGTIYAIRGRLLMLMVAHAAFDLTAYAIIYWNLESKVAHLVFK